MTENPFVSPDAIAVHVVDLDRRAGCLCRPPVVGIREVVADRPLDDVTVVVRPADDVLVRLAGFDAGRQWELLSAHHPGCELVSTGADE